MAVTAKEIINRAFGRRTANDPGKLATPKELVGVLSDTIRQLYAQVAAVGPRYFAAVSALTGPTGGKWPMPADAIVVWRAEDSTGKEVKIVDIGDKDAESPPRIFEIRPGFYSVGYVPTAAEIADGMAADPTNGTLKFYYAKQHPPLDTALDPAAITLDASWPPQHNDILVDELAYYLAVKDGRSESELTALRGGITRKTDTLLTEARLARYGQRTTHTDRPLQAR